MKKYKYDLNTDTWDSKIAEAMSNNDRLYFIERVGDVEYWAEKAV